MNELGEVSLRSDKGIPVLGYKRVQYATFPPDREAYPSSRGGLRVRVDPPEVTWSFPRRGFLSRLLHDEPPHHCTDIHLRNAQTGSLVCAWHIDVWIHEGDSLAMGLNTFRADEAIFPMPAMDMSLKEGL